jgi:nucleoid-associated protein YgaU
MKVAIEETKVGFPPISVRQPQLHDLVDDPVKVCGIATGFEARISARVRDGSGAEIVETSIVAGGTGTWGNFQAEIDLGGPPASFQGTLEVFNRGGAGGEVEVHKVVVPIVFGTALIEQYFGFEQYEVQSGDTLRTIADRSYGDANLWTRLFEGNRNQIIDPNRIFPGQVLRVPVGTG